MKEKMSNKEHRLGVSEINLVRGQLTLEPVDMTSSLLRNAVLSILYTLQRMPRKRADHYIKGS
ncbi:MAG: hypothetical protein CME43_04620 [Haliea sp.]|nr:hypothetical protein [Haliea sp.]MAY91453.1 hypothetical protein [Haliea sp.]MBM68741.1 hypothetical protein [Haliea sp.]PHQ57903.1 MAG: hypothetical protein COA29_02560 [Porticoccus sp.]